ncbi:MAG TPA: gamma-glutamyltransferase, partial [Bryobacteraceae bacterium]
MFRFLIVSLLTAAVSIPVFCQPKAPAQAVKNKKLSKKLADGRDYGRSMVISKFGIVATSQTLASQAGADILNHGGNAIDAAIAANAALSVTEPMMNGIGGDLFAIYYEAK